MAKVQLRIWIEQGYKQVKSTLWMELIPGVERLGYTAPQTVGYAFSFY
jgi:hypothetical protein